jgi:hypothetical protein
LPSPPAARNAMIMSAGCTWIVGQVTAVAIGSEHTAPIAPITDQPNASHGVITNLTAPFRFF